MAHFEIATSYFYHVRFFKPNMIPISTAVWDPKWYHDFRRESYCFVDKNGVINGLRINPLRPGESCENLCRGIENCQVRDPRGCAFLRMYRKQLDSLDFTMFMQQLSDSVDKVQKLLNFPDTPIVVFLFHEKYDNPCSERWPVQDWFKNNGINVNELKYPISQNY